MYVVLALVVIAFAFLGVRLYKIQITQGAFLSGESHRPAAAPDHHPSDARYHL
jgi:cell division protein FtsI/penicillin-binding protein 2